MNLLPKGRHRRPRNHRKAVVLTGLSLGLVVMAGCAVSTPIDQAAVIYADGRGDKKFTKVIPAGKREDAGINYKSFRYPVNSRDFQFAGDDVAGRERGPITVLDKNGIALTVKGAVYFTLNDKPEILRQFHEQVGTTFGAKSDSNEDGTGALDAAAWNGMLAKYIGVPVENALDRVTLNYTYQELISDATKKNEWQKAAADQIVQSINQVTGGTEYFCKPGYKGDGKDNCGQFSIQLNQAQPPSNISEAKADAAAAATRITSQQSQASSQANLIKQFGVDGYLQLQQQQLWRDMMNSGKITFYPVPAGGSLNLPVK